MQEKSIPIRLTTASLQPLREDIACRIEGQHFLSDVVKLLKCENRRHSIIEVISQDEFTHDVIVHFRDTIHLVYDTN